MKPKASPPETIRQRRSRRGAGAILVKLLTEARPRTLRGIWAPGAPGTASVPRGYYFSPPYPPLPVKATPRGPTAYRLLPFVAVSAC